MNKKQLDFQVNDRTISNNNNNYNNNNNNSYVLPPNEEEQNLTYSLRSQMAPPSEEKPFSASTAVSGKVLAAPAEKKNQIIDSTIPDKWDYIKLDLFDNSKPEDLVRGKTKLKIALSIKKAGQAGWLCYNAQMNSPIRNMKRGLDSATWESGHYQNVKDSYAELKEELTDVRCSKFYQKGYAKQKGRSVEDLSVIVAQHPDEGCYIINLHFLDQQWIWLMRGDAGYLNSTQRKNGIIATVGIKKANKIKNLKAGDLL
jgi:hypothetical protein